MQPKALGASLWPRVDLQGSLYAQPDPKVEISPGLFHLFMVINLSPWLRLEASKFLQSRYAVSIFDHDFFV